MNLLLLLTLMGCRQTSLPPYVGDCADYPDEIYDYGDIGVGTCLAGPTELRWITDPSDPSREVLLVGNANPWLDFSGGSVLALDLTDRELDGSDVLVSEVARSALPIDGFPGAIEIIPERDLLMVTDRRTEDARERVGFDDVLFVDISNIDELGWAPVAEEGASQITLMSDPDVMAYDAASGFAFVENFTSHTLSVLDVLADPISVYDAVDSEFVSPGRVFDVDGSGSHVDIATLLVYDSELVVDQDWSLVYSEGSHRLWLPEDGGATRWTGYGSFADWRESGLGVELSSELSGGLVTSIVDPQPAVVEGALVLSFADPGTGAIYLAGAGTYLGDWAYSDPVFEAREGEWDEVVSGPQIVRPGSVSWLFYDGVDAAGVGGIGLATSEGVANFSRYQDGPLIAPGNGAHDLERAADPYVVRDDQADVWRMFYGAWDGARWTIGHAESNDLTTWTVDPEPVFELEGWDAAAPVVVYASGQWRMWTARSDGAGWWLGQAVSPDGYRWTDLGEELFIEGSEDLVEPPGPGLQSQISRGFGLYGDTVGSAAFEMSAGSLADITSYGIQVQLSAGAWLSPSGAPTEGANGVRVDSFLPEQGLIYLTLTGEDGVERVGLADWNEGEPSIRDEVLLEGEAGAFDADGVSHPVVFAVDGGYRMLYAGLDGEVTAIGAATSSDGVTWTTDHSVALAPGEDWDSLRVLPGSVVAGADGYTLWYTGGDTDTRSRIGAATSTDGVTWTRAPGAEDAWQLGLGSPGQFDDSAVRQPWVLEIDGVEHLWYSAFDGSSWRIGYASRAEGEAEFSRAQDPVSDEPRAVLSLYTGNFDAREATRPVVWVDEEGLYNVLYTGRDALVRRSGLAQGIRPDRLYRVPRSPTTGDRVEWTTWLGDGGQTTAIDLDRQIEGLELRGWRVNQLVVDEERGYLYVTSRQVNYITVIDIRDDSTDTWRDANYLDIEGILLGNTDDTAVGFRGVLPIPGTDLLYALNDSPESVMVIDMSALPDNERVDAVPAAVVGYLPAARSGSNGLGRDEGVHNYAAIGPIRLVQREDLLFVSNYSENSIGVYDLRLGSYGALIEEVEQVGESPHAMALSPDGRHLAVANFIGEAMTGGRVSSTLTIVDVDPDSPDYLRIVARIVNQ
ncbi:MAG: beta-propeller fold lactonase family protein [Alphaproteobacteria bacterium]|nr:beta-propeller fold lactonase family protein [Alphaproteobacteria bacterium]